MYRKIICGLALLIACTLCVGGAAQEIASTYANVPSVMTEDSVVSIDAGEPREIATLPPDEPSMALLQQAFDFIWKGKNPPVRFYDEETQRAIQALIPQTDIDILHMTEFMALEMRGAAHEPVDVEMLLDVDYQPGQLVVAVLGVQVADGTYEWLPYLCDVAEVGLITFRMPAEDYESMKDQRVIFTVLTDRLGQRGGVLHTEEIKERVVFPSKEAKDITIIRRWYSRGGEPIEDPFAIKIVDSTDEMRQETERIRAYLATENSTLMGWFPSEIQEEVRLLLPAGADMSTLTAYDILAVQAENYKDTYGDVAAMLEFATTYSDNHGVVVLAGFPIAGATEAPFMEWHCLRAEPVEDDVESHFKQLILPRMEEEPAMLIVISEPLHEEGNRVEQ